MYDCMRVRKGTLGGGPGAELNAIVVGEPLELDADDGVDGARESCSDEEDEDADEEGLL